MSDKSDRLEDLEKELARLQQTLKRYNKMWTDSFSQIQINKANAEDAGKQIGIIYSFLVEYDIVFLKKRFAIIAILSLTSFFFGILGSVVFALIKGGATL